MSARISDLAISEETSSPDNTVRLMAEEIQERRAKEVSEDTFWRNMFAGHAMQATMIVEHTTLLDSGHAFDQADAMLNESKRREESSC